MVTRCKGLIYLPQTDRRFYSLKGTCLHKYLEDFVRNAPESYLLRVNMILQN